MARKERRVYLVHKENKARILFNLKDVRATLKNNPEAKARFMSLGLYNDGLRGVEGDIFSGWWDYPTFYAQSEPLEVSRI